MSESKNFMIIQISYYDTFKIINFNFFIYFIYIVSTNIMSRKIKTGGSFVTYALDSDKFILISPYSYSKK